MGTPDIVGFGNEGVFVALGDEDGIFAQPGRVLDSYGYDAGGWRVEKHLRVLADVNGDRRADIVVFGDDGVFVALGQADGTFFDRGRVLAGFGYSTGWRVEKHARLLGDFNNDGRADIVAFGNHGVFVALGMENGVFVNQGRVLDGFVYATGWRVERHPRMLGDVNGDGRADIVAFGNAGVFVALGQGNGTFADRNLVLDRFGFEAGGWRIEEHPRMLGDVNGDGRSDIVAFGDEGVFVALGQPDGSFYEKAGSLEAFGFEAGGWRVEKHPRMLGDVNGDGRSDIVAFGDDGVFIAKGTPSGAFHPAERVTSSMGYKAGGWRVHKHPRFVVDVHNDGRADVVGFGWANVFVGQISWPSP